MGLIQRGGFSFNFFHSPGGALALSAKTTKVEFKVTKVKGAKGYG